ncbi:MAG: UDP-N-acetylmuramoyl-L-alanyl-D-glutamate--2,6-diaminopimelate ligase [Candidatus Omnitrophica bacterium]|nr:UDP-N-acetylmuramoyl-L-alanyl-D-glutamate--2,6-diaminopimelate ligase [Candidatus Omnitrophota bacterium]MBU4590307.1 UDP-N-acetylmuramoyl-L-alanyl-D-glutamate--2,6-diaminopimelate ligase [Candidatus Omnitrophota bacterium]
MKLKKVIENLVGVVKVEGKASIEVRGVSCDSKAVKDGYLFVAVKGSRLNGRDFINEAIDRGASAVVLEEEKDSSYAFRRGVTFIYIEDARLALPEIARAFYGDVSSAMQLIGITGTNGKTTAAYLIESLFKSKNKKTGVIGTVNYRFGSRLIPAFNTTPGILDLYSLLSSMKKQKIRNCILEVSSHSLEQGRVDSLSFDIAIFTNLTSEHMDYHETIENYLSSKLKLFTKIKHGGSAIVNRDDACSEKIIERVRSMKSANVITYGIGKDVDVRAMDISYSFKGLKFKLLVEAKPRPLLITGRGFASTIDIESRLIGRHNVYNILASAACGIAMGMTLEDIAQGIEKLTELPGRLETIDCGQDFSVFVDYAHTENGMENVLLALKELNPKRILTVFGCGGGRDRSKRPDMGRVCSEFSDRVFITSDNPRNEEPMDIINEIIKGIPPKKNNYEIEADRFKAIEAALKEAQRGDIVLVAGKGHETYQIFKNTTLPFDDREAVKKILKER